MKDVAEHAGVSLNVVSRVCRQNPAEYVSERARERVLDSIKALGYRPDSRAQTLRGGRAQTVGFYTDVGSLSLEAEFDRVFFDGLQTGCGEHGLDLLIFHAMDTGTVTDAVRELTNAKVDGIVYQPRLGDAELSTALSNSFKPIVRVGEAFKGMPSVVAEDFDGAKRLAHHLFVRGHRRVVFRKALANLTSATRRHEGFLEAASELGMTVLTMTTDSAFEDLTFEEKQLLSNFRAEGITAVACWRDWSAGKVLLFCREQAIHVPEDLAVVGFDGLTPEFSPPDLHITTIVIDWERIVTVAVSKLVDLINNREAPDEVVQPCSLYIGNTT